MQIIPTIKMAATTRATNKVTKMATTMINTTIRMGEANNNTTKPNASVEVMILKKIQRPSATSP
jgi:hypothetical protein